MNAIFEFAMIWLMWTGAWWLVLAVGVALWFQVKRPQTAAVRHAALAAAIIAGTLAGLIPRWGDGVVSLRGAVIEKTNDVASKPTEAQPSKQVSKQALPAAFPGPVLATEEVNLAAPATTQTPALIPVVTRARDWLALGKNLIIAAWGLGALLLSVRLLRAARMTLRWRREALPLPEDERAMFVALKRELGVRRATNAGLHAEPVSPVVLCGWPPLVLAPKDWSTWEPESRRAAWRHELAHVRRFDDWWRLLSEALRVLFWFHPGVRWLLSRREQEAELLSDEAAVAAGCAPQELAQVLLDACRRPQSVAWMAPAGTFFSPKTMKVRIARLLEAPSAEALCRPAPRGMRPAAIVGIVLLAFAGSMRWIAATPPNDTPLYATAPKDLSKLARVIAKEPAYRGKPMYYLLAIGAEPEPRWLVLDLASEARQKDSENVAYLDRDGDGDLTKPGNRFVAKTKEAGVDIVSFSPDPIIRYQPQFELGDLVLADGTRHENITVDVERPIQDYVPISFQTFRGGEPRQLVATPPFASLLRGGATPTEAPVIHLDGPLQLRAVTSNGALTVPASDLAHGSDAEKLWFAKHPPKHGKRTLFPGHVFDFEAELGTPGLGRGTFAKLCCGVPPKDLHPTGEIVLPDGRRLAATLDKRCCMTIFRTKALIPSDAPVGMAQLVLRYPAWADGHVVETTDEIEILSSDEAPKVERIEPQRKARVGELLGVQIEAHPVAPRGGTPTSVEADGTIRVAELPPIVVVGKTAEEIEGLILTAIGMKRERPTHVAVCFLRSAADVPDPPKEAAVVKPKPNYVTVVGQLLDDETGKPIEKAGWEWGMFDSKKPDQIAWGHSRQYGGSYPDGKFEMLVNIGADGNHYPLRVYSAGYETTVVVDELAKPYPEKIERTIRLKRGRSITGVLRDHEGEPVANGWVFFIPKGHHSNIVEGVPGTDTHQPPKESRDGAVAEVRTNENGTFALPTGADGTLAASTDLVDLWPFPLPEDGYADLKMPAPSYLVIDLSYWYLDELAKKGKRELSPESEDPNQCWLQVEREWSNDPLWKATEYRRQMLAFAKDPRAKLSKGVTIGHILEGEMEKPIPDVGHNKNLTTKIRIALPPGAYRVQRLRAGPFAPVQEQQVVLKPGEETVISWARGDGSSVLGKATWPANMMFVRQQGEAPRKLDWTVPDFATVWIAPVGGDGKPIESAKVQADGSFFVATHLEPGKYTASIAVYMPEGDFRGGLRTADCHESQEFTVPEPARDPFGSPPVEVEIKMNVGKGGRFVAAEVSAAD